MNNDVKMTFILKPMVSLRRADKSNGQFFMAKLEITVGSYKCKSKRCQVCNNIREADLFTCSHEPANFTIYHKFDFDGR